MKRTLLILVPLLAGCAWDPAPPARPLLVRLEGTYSTHEGRAKREVVYSVEHLFLPPDHLLSTVRVGGLIRRTALSGDTGWIRMGAAVENLEGDHLAEARAWRQDLGNLLVADPDEAWPAPAPREGFLPSFAGRQELAGILLPETYRQSSRKEAMHDDQPERWEVLALRFVSAVVDPEEIPSLDRPDDRTAGALGEISRKPLRATDSVAVVHKGPLTDLAQVDLYLDDALRRAMCGKKGPIARIFTSLPGEDGVAVVKTFVPVSLSHDPGAENLPPGAVAERLPATEVLAAEYRGPYPRDGTLAAALAGKAEELGLEPAGPVRHVILSNPDEGEPTDLRQEIQLPVREKE